MKVVKRILLGLLGLLALFLLVALFIKKDFAVEREIVINKPKQEVFAYLKPLKNQSNWSTFIKKDPNIKMTYQGADGTTGSISAWDGNSDVGKGEMEIKSITEDERIDLELRFIKPFVSTAPAYFTTEALGDQQTKVKWGMSGRMAYPMNGMQLFMSMDDAIGTEYQQSLVNLKNLLEQG